MTPVETFGSVVGLGVLATTALLEGLRQLRHRRADAERIRNLEGSLQAWSKHATRYRDCFDQLVMVLLRPQLVGDGGHVAVRSNVDMDAVLQVLRFAYGADHPKVQLIAARVEKARQTGAA